MSEIGNTTAGDVVSISFPADSGLGMVIEPDRHERGAVVRSWSRLPNGKFGPVQKHGGVHLGDCILYVNEVNISTLTSAEVARMLESPEAKTLKFVNSTEYYKRKKGMKKNVPKKESKEPFISAIRRARVNTSTPKKFAEYEITSQLRLPSTQIEKEKVFQWSVWKRYSDFEVLEYSMRTDLGWQMELIDFPSSHSFAFNKLNPDFIEQRRVELDEYWKRLIALDKVTDFSKHHCSQELKEFLQVDDAINGKERGIFWQSTEEESAPQDLKESSTASTALVVAPTASSAGGDEGAEAGKRNSTRRLSTRTNARMSKKGSEITDAAYEPPSAQAASAPAVSNTSTSAAAASAPPPTKAQAPPPPMKQQSQSQPPPPPTKASAPPPPATKAPAPPPVKGPAAVAVSAPPPAVEAGKLPPKATGARAGLFADIAARRID